MLTNKCKEHCKSVGQTRWQHFKFATGVALQLQVTTIALVIHAFIPRFFITTASKKITSLAKQLEEQRNGK